MTSYRCDVLRGDGGVALPDALDPLPGVAVCIVGLLGDQAESEELRTVSRRRLGGRPCIFARNSGAGVLPACRGACRTKSFFARIETLEGKPDHGLRNGGRMPLHAAGTGA